MSTHNQIHLITPRDVERRYRINRRTLARYRREGGGPRHVRTRHGLILYRPSAVVLWRRRPR